MLELVIGAAASGKSEYAERKSIALSEKKSLIYLATMKSEDKESRERIAIHQKRRDGMGFITIECPFDIDKIKIPRPDTTILLECMSNLLANEMFDRNKNNNPAKKLFENVISLYESENVLNMVVVTNNIFHDGNTYDKATEEYIHTLGAINRLLAKKADKVTEVVCGIAL